MHKTTKPKQRTDDIKQKTDKNKEKKIKHSFYVFENTKSKQQPNKFYYKKILQTVPDNKSDWCHFNNIINEYQN